MQLGGKPIRVKLTKDLTKYDDRLIVGEEGNTMPGVKLSDFGGFDTFVAVRFDNGAKIDVTWSCIEEIK